jgi:hypothetical protein
MVDRTVRRLVLESLSITKQALSARTKKVKNRLGPMTTEEAVYVIAHGQGIDLAKYLPIGVVDRVRALVPRDSAIPKAQPAISRRTGPRSRSKTLSLYPLLTATQMDQANQLGSTVYPLVYQIENSLRELISRRLSIYGKDWWTTRTPADVQKNVSRTMDREKRYPYRDKRGSYPIFYANFDDLKRIVLANGPDFEPILVKLDWFTVRMEEVYMARNNLAHCVPLPRDDVSRIELFHRDLARILVANPP